MIYFASPLHDKEDRDYNTQYVSDLRSYGYLVYLPQEHGVWEDLLKQFNNDEVKTRKYCYKNDIIAMQRSDMCIAMAGNLLKKRAPSEGMLWEMGYMTACNKPVLLLNPDGQWKYNLMPEFGSTMFRSWKALMDWMRAEVIPDVLPETQIMWLERAEAIKAAKEKQNAKLQK